MFISYKFHEALRKCFLNSCSLNCLFPFPPLNTAQLSYLSFLHSSQLDNIPLRSAFLLNEKVHSVNNIVLFIKM